MDINSLKYVLAFIIIYSFAGWVLETVSKSVEEKQFVNSGFLNGPICPIYGLGAMLMLLILKELKENSILLFLASFVLLTVWEYFVGIFLEKVFKTKYWDYSHLKFNFQGRVCLKNSIYWGILGIIFIRLVHPFIEQIVTKIPEVTLTYVLIILYSIFIVDIVYSIITVLSLENSLQRVNELGENIKLKIEELKTISTKSAANSIKANKENMEKIIYELKIKEIKLKWKIYRRAKRLKMAFPTMKSESITQFLNQKVDLETLKKILKKKP